MTEQAKTPHETLTQEAWLRRYAQRFIEIAGLTRTHADACARADTFKVLSESFEDDPEGAADEEISYWDFDEDEEAQ